MIGAILDELVITDQVTVSMMALITEMVEAGSKRAFWLPRRSTGSMTHA
jgi:hypothetical protein